MFHLLGVGQLSIAAFAGATISVYPPVSPPMPPTPDSALSHAVATGSTFAIFPPILLHAYMMKPKETLPLLATFTAIVRRLFHAALLRQTQMHRRGTAAARSTAL